MSDVVVKHTIMDSALSGLENSLAMSDSVFPLSVVCGTIGPLALTEALSYALGVVLPSVLSWVHSRPCVSCDTLLVSCLDDGHPTNNLNILSRCGSCCRILPVLNNRALSQSCDLSSNSEFFVVAKAIKCWVHLNLKRLI